MDPRYTHEYAQVLRSPLLFHQNTVPTTPNYYPVQPRGTPSSTNLYLPRSTPHSLQSQYLVQAPLPINPQTRPYYSTLPGSPFPSAMPYSYSIPTVTYPTTSSSKGLALILIATLILVALDLVMVRPQKKQNNKLTLLEP